MTERVDVVLVYPQRAPRHGRHWIMPSLGLMYLSASLRRPDTASSTSTTRSWNAMKCSKRSTVSSRR